MAKKKSRKKRSRKAPKMHPAVAPAATSTTADVARVEEVKKSAGTTQTGTTTSEDLRQEYWYVYNDLKRIAVVAGALFAVMIGLSFFL